VGKKGKDKGGKDLLCMLITRHEDSKGNGLSPKIGELDYIYGVGAWPIHISKKKRGMGETKSRTKKAKKRGGDRGGEKWGGGQGGGGVGSHGQNGACAQTDAVLTSGGAGGDLHRG